MIEANEPNNDIAQAPSVIVHKPLKHRHSLFVKEYMLSKNASLACRNAGYSTKRPHVEGYRLMRNPAIKAEIARLEALEVGKIDEKLQEQAEKREISREKFTETAWKHFENESEATVKPRYLDIAGRALGYLGKDGDSRPHQTLIVNVDPKSLDSGQRWDRLRQLIDGS